MRHAPLLFWASLISCLHPLRRSRTLLGGGYALCGCHIWAKCSRTFRPTQTNPLAANHEVFGMTQGVCLREYV